MADWKTMVIIPWFDGISFKQGQLWLTLATYSYIIMASHGHGLMEIQSKRVS